MKTKILKLIETVSPDDAAKLDEIDERVWCYLNECDTQKLKLGDACRIYTTDSKFWPLGYKVVVFNGVKYTRSRDALKAIRSKHISAFHVIKGTSGRAYLNFWLYDHNGVDELEKSTPILPTEELAELHATIQAIAYNREKQ